MTANNSEQIKFWNGDGGVKWTDDQERLDQMLSPISDATIELANPKPKERVLDIGCGCGATSVELAKLGAQVAGVDVSAPMLARARERGVDYPSLSFRESDASTAAFSAEHQLVFSRFGVMFFADPVQAFSNLRSALVTEGRLVFVCWQSANKNEWISRVGNVVRPYLPGPAEVPDPRAPGPFAFADSDYLKSVLQDSGFREIVLSPLTADLTLASTIEGALDFQSKIGPLASVLAQLQDQAREEAMAAARSALADAFTSDGVKLGSAVWLVQAKN